MKELASLLPLAAIAVIFWLVIIRPQSRRHKALVQMQSALKIGDQVMLTSGIFGRLTELTDERVKVEVAPGVVLEAARGAVGSIESAPEPGPDADQEVN